MSRLAKREGGDFRIYALIGLGCNRRAWFSGGMRTQSFRVRIEQLPHIRQQGAWENRPLMKAMDLINPCFPKAISVAATGFDKSWKPKIERVSEGRRRIRGVSAG